MYNDFYFYGCYNDRYQKQTVVVSELGLKKKYTLITTIEKTKLCVLICPFRYFLNWSDLFTILPRNPRGLCLQVRKCHIRVTSFSILTWTSFQTSNRNPNLKDLNLLMVFSMRNRRNFASSTSARPMAKRNWYLQPKKSFLQNHTRAFQFNPKQIVLSPIAFNSNAEFLLRRCYISKS